jgi:hypothetical protein
MALPWLIISVLVLLVLFGIIAIIVAKKGGKKPTDYYAFFIMGITWIPFGIFMWFMDRDGTLGIIFLALGITYTAIGLAHKKDWKKNKRPPLIKNKLWRWLMILGLVVLFVLLGIYVFARG